MLYFFMFKLRGGHKEILENDWMPTTQSPWLSTYPNRPGQSNQHHQSTVNQHYLDPPLMSCTRRNEDTTTIHKKTMINSFPTFVNCLLYKCNMHLDRMPCMLSSKTKINNRLVTGNKERNKVIGSTLSSINCISFHFKWKSKHFTSCGEPSIPPRVENRATSSGQNPSFHFMWKSKHSTSCGKQSIPPRVENKLSTSCGRNSCSHLVWELFSVSLNQKILIQY
jgi:hypothetical protein